jgi:hypothetical protein
MEKQMACWLVVIIIMAMDEEVLPDFSWYVIPKPGKNVPKLGKMYQIHTKCTKWS